MNTLIKQWAIDTEQLLMQLDACLTDEMLALSQLDSKIVEQTTQKKRELMELLIVQEEKRQQLYTTEKYAETTKQKWYQHIPDLEQTTQQILQSIDDLLLACNKQNQINGRLIAGAQYQQHKLLSIFVRAEVSDDIYDTKGRHSPYFSSNTGRKI